MTALEKFKVDMANWIYKNGFDEIGLCFGQDFAYVLLEDGRFGIQIGTEGYPEVGRYFEQFLYEYGLEYMGIYDPVLAFLHELGHAQTLNYFSDLELKFFELAKESIDSESEYDRFVHYWSLPDEFAANMWAINFINEHKDAVDKLCQIYWENWNEAVEELEVA